MSKTKTKAEQVIEAAGLLAAEGVTPTMEKVRERMGGGSFATISPVLRAWKAEHQAEAVQAEEAPPEAIEAGTRAATVIWSAAMQTTAARIKKAEAEAEESVSAAEQERDTALADITRLEKEAGQAIHELEIERRELAAARTTIAEAEAKAAERGVQLRKLAGDLEAAHTEALNSTGRESRLAADLDAAKKQADASAAQMASLQEQAERTTEDQKRELEQLRAEIKVIGQELGEAKTRASSAERLLASAEERAKGAEIRERSARDLTAELRGQLSVLEASAPTAAKKILAARRKPAAKKGS